MAPQVFTDRYEIIRHLARGGMAEVYLARDLLLDRPVALKVLFPEFASDRSFVERFRREARAAAGLNHPNIVSIYDWGEEGGTYFIVMEYVEGRTLREIIRSEGPLHPIRAAEIAAEIAAALAFAHKGGAGSDRDGRRTASPVIHRDVKPGNVIISNLVKVTDFGIARAGDPGESLTQTGAVMGTATYFSPEQAQGHPIDPRSDVYSLGVVLYEMLTGRPPFTGDSPVAIAYQHVREPAEPPSHRNPDVPPQLEAIVMKALAKNRANRYPSADAFRADLLRFANGQPVSAEPLMAPPAAFDDTRASAVAETRAQPTVDGGTRMMPRAAHTELVEDEWEPVEDRRGPRTSTYIAILLGLLAVLGFMLYLLARELGVGAGSEVVVPPVVGDPQADAVRKIEAAELKVSVKEGPSDGGEAGRVLAQDPEPGTRVKKSTTVTITVVGAVAEVDVPDVRGRPVDDARRILEERKFVVRTDPRASADHPPNQVIDQNPRPGKAPEGSVVNLVVSSGPEEVVVPSLFGATEASAAQNLVDRGFRVERRTVADAQVAAGLVIRTEPGAGTPVRKGSTVTIVVSTGPPPTTAAPTTTSPPTTAPPTTQATTTTSSTTTSTTTTTTP